MSTAEQGRLLSASIMEGSAFEQVRMSIPVSLSRRDFVDDFLLVLMQPSPSTTLSVSLPDPVPLVCLLVLMVHWLSLTGGEEKGFDRGPSTEPEPTTFACLGP